MTESNTVEVSVKLIRAGEGEPELQDGRLNTPIHLVPVVYDLADGHYVNTYKRFWGTKEEAQAWMHALPMEPTYPTRCVFDDEGYLQNVIVRMVMEPA